MKGFLTPGTTCAANSSLLAGVPGQGRPICEEHGRSECGRLVSACTVYAGETEAPAVGSAVTRAFVVVIVVVPLHPSSPLRPPAAPPPPIGCPTGWL